MSPVRSIERNGRVYASRALIGDNGDDYFKGTALDKALNQGWSEGCPVAVTLTKEPVEGGRGAEVMAKRYGEVNFWSGYITRVLQEQGRNDLLRDLPGTFKRLKGEPIGKHDEGWTPELLEGHMMLIPHAYSLPRLLINYINGDPQITTDERQLKMSIAIESLEQAASQAKNLDQLLTKLTRRLVLFGGNVRTLLKTMLPQGKLGEDNCHTAYENIVKEMQSSEPDLYKAYMHIPAEDKAKMGMANIRI